MRVSKFKQATGQKKLVFWKPQTLRVERSLLEEAPGPNFILFFGHSNNFSNLVE